MCCLLARELRGRNGECQHKPRAKWEKAFWGVPFLWERETCGVLVSYMLALRRSPFWCCVCVA